MGFDVELASNVSTKTFSDEEEATLQSFVEGNTGQYTYAEIAEAFAGGNYSAKSIQGKILSMELTSHVKPTEKPASVRTYSPEEEATFLGMVADGAFVEDIASALNRPINSSLYLSNSSFSLKTILILFESCIFNYNFNINIVKYENLNLILLLPFLRIN